ncbi:phosphatidate cytidylyltransferase [Acetobacteraceae bacterium H6797]|nr:phosphatidate cytidylyltransferase [Acetobacteraceae bacterium H6797]
MSDTKPVSRWPDLRKRFLSAAILAPLAVTCIWFGAEPWTAMMAVAVALLSWEWVRLSGQRTRTAPGVAVPAVVLLACALAVAEQPRLGLIILLLGFVATYIWARLPDVVVGPPVRALRLAFGILYIGFAGLALIVLRHDSEAGRSNVVFLFCVVWASDIGAYLAGRLFGGPKLWPAVSPNKTWSGAIGGVVSVILVGMLVSELLVPGSLPRAAAIAVLLGIATQIGDLLESAMKRRFNVKDSSRLIPGHGGLLDRLDGLMIAAPVAALIAMWRGVGVPLWW